MNKNSIYIYLSDVSSLENEIIFNKYYNLCSEKRKEKTDKLKFRKDKNLSVGAEALLISALKDLKINFRDIELNYNKYNKPFFKDIDLYFNISHSEKYVMCLISDFEVGCDIEYIKRGNLRIAEKYFSEEENKFINSCETDTEKITSFYKIWTLKESFIKCVGDGLSIPLNSFSVINNGLEVIKQSINNYKYRLYNFSDLKDYSYSVCIKDEVTNIEKRDFDIHTKFISLK